VLALTLVAMVGEIVAGTVFGSMALLADGWHMGSHAAALGIAVLAYAYAHRHAGNSAYTFGTGKVGDLAAFSSALLLFIIAALMAVESVQRLLSPVSIAFNQALLVAVLGLAINLVSAWLLREDHGHGHDHAGSEHHNHDHNLRAAYMHVLADAMTSVLAIAALVGGLLWGLLWLDAVMGIVGAAIIVRWAVGLMGTAGRVLLDAAPAGDVTESVRGAIEAEADNRIADLHVWRIGPGHLAAVVTVVTHHARTPAHYKSLLAGIPCLSHVTVEVERCCDQQPHAA
jgi:cation diffusion facilitator family transporter